MVATINLRYDVYNILLDGINLSISVIPDKCIGLPIRHRFPKLVIQLRQPRLNVVLLDTRGNDVGNKYPIVKIIKHHQGIKGEVHC
jgi:hypothetical protein